MSNFDPPLPGVIIDPNGQEPVINITNAAGTLATAFVDTFAVTPITFPMTLQGRTTVYLAGEGPWTISAKVNGNELAGNVLGLEGNQVGTITLPAPLTAGQLATLQTDPQQLVANYNISASLATYTTTATAGAKTLTIGGGHDFQVGHGVAVVAAGNNHDSLVPPTPTIAQGGTPGSTTYQYQVAALLSNNFQVDGMSQASAAGSTTTGAATLNATNYNKVQFTPGNDRYGYAVYGRTSGSMQLLGYVWTGGAGLFRATVVPNANQPPFVGANLSTNTTYNYQVTGIDMAGNETPPIYWPGIASTTVTASTGAQVNGIKVDVEFFDAPGIQPFKTLNIYRATGAGAYGFLVQINAYEECYLDYGLVAPNLGVTPPTVLTFIDNGMAQLTGTAARPDHVPVAPPATFTPSVFYSTVTATTPTTITLAAGLSASVTSQLVAHDDTAAINAAIAALNTVTLPDGTYPIRQRVTIGPKQTLQGLAMPNPLSTAVTASANATPSGGAILCLYSLRSQQQINMNGIGPALHNVTLFWPHQANGLNTNPQQVIPFPASVNHTFASLWSQITGIYDANSYIGVQAFNCSVYYKDFWCGFLRFEILAQVNESILQNFKSDPNIYSGSCNLPQQADRTCIRTTNCGLNEISNISVDGCTSIWVTRGNNQFGGNGSFPDIISNVWTDDWSPSLVIDSPVSDNWNAGGQQYGAFITNYQSVPGSGGAIFTTGYSSLQGGANGAFIEVTNSTMIPTLNGQMVFRASGCSFGTITSNATSAWFPSPYNNIQLVGCGTTSPRITTLAGATKVRISAGGDVIGNNWGTDTVTGGTLYVIDEQGMRTERFTIPTGTVLATGDNTIGHLVVGQMGAGPAGGAQTLYVITATGSGTSATDVWKLNGTTMFTTAATVSSLKVGGIGEGVNAHIQGVTNLPLLTPAMSITLTTGTSFIVYPVVLNVAAGLTTSTPLELELTYCLTPQTI